MKKSDFRQLLGSGYGSALIFLKKCDDPMEYARQIEYCCTHNTCFDMQCEGDRADYLFEAICLTGQESHFLESIMRRLENERNLDDWECQQMISILVLYRRKGYSGAAEFLDRLFERKLKELSTGKMHPDRCRRDGFENLCTVLSDEDESYFMRTVKNVGKYLTEYPNSDMFSLDYFYMRFLRDKGKEYSRKLLKDVPREYVKAFDNAFYDPEHFLFRRYPKNKPEKRPRPSFDRLMECLNGDEDIGKKQLTTRLFAKSADEADLKRLAELMLSEKDGEKQLIMLGAFIFRPFPLDSGKLFSMYDSGSEELREKLFYVMCKISDNEELVKKYAAKELSKLPDNADSELMAAALDAYVSKAKGEDVKYLLSVLENAVFDEGQLHMLYRDIEKAFRRYPTRRAKEILAYIYSRMSCTFCRYYVIKAMSKCRCLSDKILDEACYDANPDTRAYAEKLLARRK
ncbi:MAG: hypothetical protein PUI48_02030 [Oscillospiraceae bacterium]|nr:hypothetical protein [Oscillospiraceae bacterium]MDY6209422.1 hypothetical protein [Oscillospiraceae bacterium]